MPTVRAFRQGLNEVGYVEGESVAIHTAGLKLSWINTETTRMPGLTRPSSLLTLADEVIE